LKVERNDTHVQNMVMPQDYFLS